MQDGLIGKLAAEGDLSDAELLAFFTQEIDEDALFSAADAVRRRHYGDAVYLRGLIELTNHCRCNCNYCGIRCGNKAAMRYRLTDEQVMACCAAGYARGFRTFVLQGGEDVYYTDARLCALVSAIHTAYPDCAVTLSLGERSRESYCALFEAGARRYLLRHETADPAHFAKLHPSAQTLSHRMECLAVLKEIGYQVGAGFMIGSPYQTPQCILSDIRYLQKLRPAMIGVGPFMPHPQTPFADQPAGELHFSLKILAMLRLLFPKALIPATTAFGALHPIGQRLALSAGANVIMPNLTPDEHRVHYNLYRNKTNPDPDIAAQIAAAGYRAVVDIGDAKTDL